MKTGFVPHAADNRGQAPEILNAGDMYMDAHSRDMKTAFLTPICPSDSRKQSHSQRIFLLGRGQTDSIE
jgi:hypothetical protein